MIVVLPSLIFALSAVLAVVSLAASWVRFGSIARANLAALRTLERAQASHTPAVKMFGQMKSGATVPIAFGQHHLGARRLVYRPLTPRPVAVLAGPRAAA